MLTIYKASAGSGKTYQLALYYIKMLLGIKKSPEKGWSLNPALLTDKPSQAHRGLLAITFTNKATEEMKNRIISNLYALSNANDVDSHPYIKELINEFDCTFEDLTKAASRAMVSLLLDFSFFNVSTIDSFFQTIMRTFARELGIQGDYNIEIETETAIVQALNLMFESLETNHPTDEIMKEKIKTVKAWLKNQVNDKTGKFNPFKRQSSDFKKFVDEIKKIYSEDFKNLQKDFFDYLENPDNLKKLQKALTEKIENVKHLQIACGCEIDDMLMKAGQYKFIKKKIINIIDLLKDGSVNLDSPPSNIKYLLNDNFEEALKLNKNEIPNEATVSAINEFSHKLKEINSLYHTSNLLLNKIPHLEFISLVKKFIDIVCEQSNMLILSDTSSYVTRIVGGSEIPFIYEHLGTHLRHFLIDEFQDTSRLQWKNLHPLVANSHDDGDDSLIIGDVKQAIYRFRNSDASILGNDLENVDFSDENRRIIRGTTRKDNCNYRTAHGIVKFNNTIMPLFSKNALDYTNPYYEGANIQQMCAASTATLPSLIALHPVFKKEENDKENQTYCLDGNMLTQPPLSDENAKIELILHRIRHQHNEDKIPWKDIAILYRANSNVNKLVEEIIRQGDIPIQSSESLYLKNAPSIRLLVSLLRMLATAGMPNRKKERKEEKNKDGKAAYKSQSREAMDHVVFESRYNYFLYQGGPGGTPLTPQQAIEMAIDSDFTTDENSDEENPNIIKSLEDTINKILKSHPSTLIATIEAVLASGLIPTKTRNEEKDYIAAFTDLALDYSTVYDNDLLGFLQWWEKMQHKASVVPPPDYDAVRIMTIHKAKGLEFKCVHLVDFDWVLFKDSDSLWLDVRPEHNDESEIDLNLGIDTCLIPPLVNFKLKELNYAASPFAQYCEKQKNLMKIDSLNIAYVGMTRAVSQLDIYYNPNKEGTIGKALADALDELVGKPVSDEKPDVIYLPPESYNPETKAFLLELPASKQTILQKEEKKEDDVEAEQEALKISENYTSVVRSDMAAIISVESLQTSGTEDIEEGMEDDPLSHSEANTLELSEAIIRRRQRQKMEKTQRGLDLHEILSHIPYYTGELNTDTLIDSAIEESSRSEGFVMANKDQYGATVREMLNKPEVSRWFSPSNHIDTEIAYHRPWQPGDKNDPYQLGITRRIDRLVELADGSIEIVDYKFSKVQDIKYHQQVQEYMNAASELFPGRPVRGYLWYWDLNLVVEVKEKD